MHLFCRRAATPAIQDRVQRNPAGHRIGHGTHDQHAGRVNRSAKQRIEDVRCVYAHRFAHHAGRRATSLAPSRCSTGCRGGVQRPRILTSINIPSRRAMPMAKRALSHPTSRTSTPSLVPAIAPDGGVPSTGTVPTAPGVVNVQPRIGNPPASAPTTALNCATVTPPATGERPDRPGRRRRRGRPVRRGQRTDLSHRRAVIVSSPFEAPLRLVRDQRFQVGRHRPALVPTDRHRRFVRRGHDHGSTLLGCGHRHNMDATGRDPVDVRPYTPSCALCARTAEHGVGLR